MKLTLLFITRYLLITSLAVVSIAACQSPTADTDNAESSQDFTTSYALNRETQAWENEPKAIMKRIQSPSFPDTTFDIMAYPPTTSSDDRPTSIQQAIDACHTAGGGKVVVPAGEWFLKGPIHLKSNVHLYLEEGATLVFSDDPQDYLPLVKVRWEGTVCWNYSPLIYAYQAQNIAITGKGTIDGNGREWSMEWRKRQNPDKDTLRQMGNDLVPEDQRVFGAGFLDRDGDGQDDGYGDGEQHWLRPTLIELYECENILIEELTLKNSPFWTVHPVFSKNVTIKNLKIYGGYLNDDGIDPDSCEDVWITGCYIETEDDAIAIKAGRDQDAWDRPSCQNVIIQNCQLNSGVNSFCIGSEMSGGVENVFVEDCHILSGRHGLNFKCNLDRGGQVQHIYMRNIEIDSVEDAMFIFRMDYHGYRGNHYPTQFNDFYASHITCKQVDGLPFKIVGVEDQPITRVSLRDITITAAAEKSQFQYAEDILLNDVRINGELITR